MSTQPDGTDGWDPDIRDTDGEGVIDPGDLAEDPRTDPEALCLCALLWAPTPAAARVTGLLRPTDFYDPRYAELCDLIRTAAAAGEPHDPASIATTITANGAGHRGVLLRRALTDVTVAGAGPEAAAHYALALARTAYRPPRVRRGRYRAGPGRRRAPRGPAVRAPGGRGSERRAAAQRLDALRAALRS